MTAMFGTEVKVLLRKVQNLCQFGDQSNDFIGNRREKRLISTTHETCSWNSVSQPLGQKLVHCVDRHFRERGAQRELNLSYIITCKQAQVWRLSASSGNARVSGEAAIVTAGGEVVRKRSVHSSRVLTGPLPAGSLRFWVRLRRWRMCSQINAYVSRLVRYSSDDHVSFHLFFPWK